MAPRRWRSRCQVYVARVWQPASRRRPLQSLASHLLRKWSKEMENIGSLCRKVPTALLTGHSAATAMLQTTEPTVPTLRLVTSISLDLWRSIWLPFDLQQTPTWSKLSLPGYRQLTPNSLRRDTRLGTRVEQIRRWWPRSCQICTISYSGAMCSLCYFWNCFVKGAVPTRTASEVPRTSFCSVMMLCHLYYIQSSSFYFNQTTDPYKPRHNMLKISVQSRPNKTDDRYQQMFQETDSLWRREKMPVPPMKGCPTIRRLDGETNSSRLPENKSNTINSTKSISLVSMNALIRKYEYV